MEKESKKRTIAMNDIYSMANTKNSDNPLHNQIEEKDEIAKLENFLNSKEMKVRRMLEISSQKIISEMTNRKKLLI